MSPEELRTRTERFIEEVLNQHNLAVVDQFIAPEYLLQDSEPPIQGPDGYRQFIEGILVIFPDIHFTLDEFFAVGDKIAFRWSIQATHKGTWGVIPATGKTVRDKGIIISHVNAQGKTVEEWITNDGLGILRQLGGLPTPTATPA
ncbi:MAG: ester cyclase [Chloroflexi bacterium]|jgi:predicted ester cyclase|nr:ester cyclase [Chloroflexota bacterium]